MDAPKIDARGHHEIMAKIAELSAQYVPELTNQEGVRFALEQIFAHMTGHIINGLNKVPDKNFIAFLKMLGTYLAPPQPARVPLKFYLSEGAPEDALVPARTRAATSAKESSPPVFFETEKAINATISQLKAVYSVDPYKDEVYCHTSELENGFTTELFAGLSYQQHALYLGHENLFNLKENAEDFMHSCVKLISEQGDLDFAGVEWAFWGYDSTKKIDDWVLFDKEVDSDGFIILKKFDSSPSKPIVESAETENRDYYDILNELQRNKVKEETFWIRAKFTERMPKSMTAATIGVVKGCIINKLSPDLAFYNDVPINLGEPFYPFGLQPNTHDAFYIGSQEGFSKKKLQVTITFTLASYSPSKNTDPTLLLSWEYWNGNGWSALKDAQACFENENQIVSPSSFTFHKSGNVTFKCPSDIAQTEIGGVENYWIRIRIVSGNYGFQICNEEAMIISNIKTPMIESIEISNGNGTELQKLDYCLAKNNLQFSKCATGTLSKPLMPLEEENQTLWLGFDKPFSTGRISIFFLLENQEYWAEIKPRIEWRYSKTSGTATEWSHLQVLDTTAGLTISGTIEFVGLSDISKTRRFGQELYWIRAEVVEGKFYNIQEIQHALSEIKTPQLVNEPRFSPIISIGSCAQFFHSKFGIPVEIRSCQPSPRVKGIYLNSTWAIQTETVNDEILGTSDGTASQIMGFSRHSVLSESVWIQEATAPARKPTEELEENQVIVDNTGLVWVKWQPIEDFIEADEKGRHYVVDRFSGQIKFGDGKNGMIPPVDAQIKATYQTGGGAAGNVGPAEAINLLTSIAFIDKVANPSNAYGGADAELLDAVLEKGPKRIQHRKRAVTKEDYEWLAKEASREVARAECLPNFSDEGKPKPGNVSLIIVPESKEDRPTASPELLKTVEDYIKSLNPASVATLTVTHPTYVSISVAADLYVSSIEAASTAKFEATKRLTEFLHPLRGGYYGNGWPFGRMPCLSDIIALLDEIEMVVHVDNLSVTVKEEKQGTFFDETTTASYVSSELRDTLILPQYVLVSSGVHKIAVHWEG